jgi:hypothetical protein
MAIMGEHGFSKVFSCWVTHMPTVAHKEKERNWHCTQYDMEGEGFQSQIVKECSQLSYLNRIQPYKIPNTEEIHGLLKKNCKDTTVAMTRQCRMPCITGCRGRRATFMRLENRLLFKVGIRMLTNMATTLKNNYAFSNVVVKDS